MSLAVRGADVELPAICGEAPFLDRTGPEWAGRGGRWRRYGDQHVRAGSIKRVAAAVGEGASAIHSLHLFLGTVGYGSGAGLGGHYQGGDLPGLVDLGGVDERGLREIAPADR